MRIEINPRSLFNLETICEVLYKLHPSVLNYLVEMERNLGGILGMIDLNNLSLEEREFLADNFKEKDYIVEVENDEEMKEEDLKENVNGYIFHEFRKYLQLDTDEYIPMKISVEVEDPVIGRKVRELVRALERHRVPDHFYLSKRELDEKAYFAEGYNLKINKEQEKQRNDFFGGEDVEALKELLRKEKLFP